jgi:hypothetical protein
LSISKSPNRTFLQPVSAIRPSLPESQPPKGPPRACVADKIDQFAAEFGNPATGASEQLLTLKFLLHFVGDLHQPLHAADDHDAGGNKKLVAAVYAGRTWSSSLA